MLLDTHSGASVGTFNHQKKITFSKSELHIFNCSQGLLKSCICTSMCEASLLETAHFHTTVPQSSAYTAATHTRGGIKCQAPFSSQCSTCTGYEQKMSRPLPCAFGSRLPDVLRAVPPQARGAAPAQENTYLKCEHREERKSSSTGCVHGVASAGDCNKPIHYH